jgi:hypothetical protein
VGFLPAAPRKHSYPGPPLSLRQLPFVAFKQGAWKLVHFITPTLHEKLRSRPVGVGYPRYFDETRTIFIHVPKAGGNSIAHPLYGVGVGHHTWRYYLKINPSKYRNYFKFAVMREPISRFVSAFDYLKEGGSCEDDRVFSETVLKPFENANELALALGENNFASQIVFGDWDQFRPQAHFIADETGDLKIDLLIRFDQLAQGFKKVARKLNRDVPELPHFNKSRIRPKFVFDQKALGILSDLYHEDFRIWNRYCPDEAAAA